MTNEQFFNELQTSLGQAIEHAKGNPAKARKKTVAIKELATFTAQDIKTLRHQMSLTQKSFAALMDVSVKIIEA